MTGPCPIVNSAGCTLTETRNIHLISRRTSRDMHRSWADCPCKSGFPTGQLSRSLKLIRPCLREPPAREEIVPDQLVSPQNGSVRRKRRLINLVLLGSAIAERSPEFRLAKFLWAGQQRNGQGQRGQNSKRYRMHSISIDLVENSVKISAVPND